MELRLYQEEGLDHSSLSVLCIAFGVVLTLIERTLGWLRHHSSSFFAKEWE